MSGYDSDTGIFSLTENKAIKYLGINKSIRKPITVDWCTYCIKLFTDKGYTVLKETAYGIDVVADNAQVWEVLSGEQATWGHSNPTAQDIYNKQSKIKKPLKDFLNATEIGQQFDPALSAIKINKILEQHKYQEKIDGSWHPTHKGISLVEIIENNHDPKKQFLIWDKKIIKALKRLV